MKKIKIIAMDFDGTLLPSNKRITDRTRECLISLKNKHYVIIGVTELFISPLNVTDTFEFTHLPPISYQ